MTDLGALSPARNSHAAAVNGDGSVVVGDSQLDVGGGPQTRAFRWTQATGMVNLGVLPGHTASSATAVSANGAVVVGISDPTGIFETGIGLQYADTARAFRWTQATGIQNFQNLLTASGVDLTGATLISALGISPGGQFIRGEGLFPNLPGQRQNYVIRYLDAATTAEPAPVFFADPAAPTPTPTPTPTPQPPIGGITTIESVQTSIDALQQARRRSAVHMHGFTAPLLGDNQPIGSPSEVGIFATAGSAALGGKFRIAYGNGLSLTGGLSSASEKYRGARMDEALIGALSLRYVHETGGALRPFAQIGGWYAPDARYRFTRDYINGAGLANGTGTTRGEQSYWFARLGLAAMLTPATEAALSAEIGRQSLHTKAFGEAMSAANPFEANYSAATDRMTIGKLRAQITHSFTPEIDATLWGAFATSLHAKNNLVAAVTGIGPFTARREKPSWFEYGARIGYRITQQMQIDVFANGVAGNRGIGHKIHAGAALKFTF